MPPPPPPPPPPLLDLPRSCIAYQFLYASFGLHRQLAPSSSLQWPSSISSFSFSSILFSSPLVLFFLPFLFIRFLLYCPIPGHYHDRFARFPVERSGTPVVAWHAGCIGLHARRRQSRVHPHTSSACTLPGHRTASSSPPYKLGSIYGKRFADGVIRGYSTWMSR